MREIVAADAVRDGHMPAADLEPLRHSCVLQSCLRNRGEAAEDGPRRCALGSRGVNVRVSSYAHGCLTTGQWTCAAARKHRVECLFTEIHINSNRLDTKEKLTQFIEAEGYNSKRFSEIFDSFGTDLRVKKASRLANQYQITSVPTLIINGKYKFIFFVS